MPRDERRRREERESAPKKPAKRDRNAAKWAQIAILLRRIADLLEAPEEDDVDEKPRRRAPMPEAPPVIPPPSDIDRKRAEEDLRRLGYKLR